MRFPALWSVLPVAFFLADRRPSVRYLEGVLKANQLRREMSRRSSFSVTVSVSDGPSGPLISSFVTFVRRRTFPTESVSNVIEIVPEMISVAR